MSAVSGNEARRTGGRPGVVLRPPLGKVLGADGRSSRRASTAVFCLVLLGLTLGALGHVAVQAKTVEVQAALGREKNLHNELQLERRQLETEINRLRTPGRLEQVARETLGMDYVDPNAIRVVTPAGGRAPKRGGLP